MSAEHLINSELRKKSKEEKTKDGVMSKNHGTNLKECLWPKLPRSE